MFVIPAPVSLMRGSSVFVYSHGRGVMVSDL